MAQEYEVRDEFRSHSLSQLMDDPVLCFQGVGEIQAELLKQYFAIATVRDLANWKQFLWALEIQEIALNGGDLAHTSIRDIAKTAELKFQVRERSLDLTPEALMHGSVQDLEDLTPAQDLALYDIFRITNIAQLAHNRIMLEARVIQYLEGQAHGASAEAVPADGVDSVMGRVATSPMASAAAQRITEGRKSNRDERLHTMANETRDHVRERISAVRDRARGRAASVTGGQSERASAIAQGAQTSTSTHRLEAIRATRERTDSAGAQQAASPERVTAVAGRRTTVAASAGHERGALDDTRSLRSGAAGVVLASRGLANNRSASGGLPNRAASVLAARGGASAGARYSGGGGGGTSYGGRPGGGGGGSGGGGSSATRTATTTSTSTAKTTTTITTTTTASAAAVAAAAVPPGETRTLTGTQGRGGPSPMVWLAVAGVIIIGVIAYFALRGTQPGPGTATTGTAPSGAAAPGAVTPGSAATGTATQPKTGTAAQAPTGSTTQPGGATGTAGRQSQTSGATTAQTGSASSAKTGTATGTATITGQAGAPGVAKTIHTVREGQSLWRISRRYYSVGHDWPVIYKENQDKIKEPDLIYPKQQFRIPPKQ